MLFGTFNEGSPKFIALSKARRHHVDENHVFLSIYDTEIDLAML